MAKIEYTRAPKEGKTHTIGGVSYHFQPDGPGQPAICEVANPDHVARFLEIGAQLRTFRLVEIEAGEAALGARRQPEPEPEPEAEATDEPEAEESEPTPADALDDLSDAKLRARFKATLQREPSKRATRESMIDQITQAEGA